jgi:catechol 2,3-dioxygenase-like lactoylglutathione lyase family enzyme
LYPSFTYEEETVLSKGNLRGLQHIGLPVTNLERSKTFYSELGFVEVMRTDLPRASEAVQVAMMRHEELTLELYQLEHDARQEIAGRTDGHIDHIALDVLDIEQAYQDIQAAGLAILEENAPVFLPFWEHGVRFFTIRGPDGEKVEFNQILRMTFNIPGNDPGHGSG